MGILLEKGGAVMFRRTIPENRWFWLEDFYVLDPTSGLKFASRRSGGPASDGEADSGIGRFGQRTGGQ